MYKRQEHGGSDPNYDDGVNMNLTRNHIIYYKNELEDLYGEDMPINLDRMRFSVGI